MSRANLTSRAADVDDGEIVLVDGQDLTGKSNTHGPYSSFLVNVHLKELECFHSAREGYFGTALRASQDKHLRSFRCLAGQAANNDRTDIKVEKGPGGTRPGGEDFEGEAKRRGLDGGQLAERQLQALYFIESVLFRLLLDHVEKGLNERQLVQSPHLTN